MQPDLAIPELTRSLEAGTPVYAIHYACESIVRELDGPAGVSAIGIAPVRAGLESLFSITDHPSSTDAEKKTAEVSLLIGYYDWLRDHPDARVVHWGMDKGVYGFGPIANRYAFLTGQTPPPSHPEDRLFNLDKLLAYRYGPNY